MKWETVHLGDLYEIHNGLSKGGKFFGSGYPFLSFSTVFNHFFIPDELSDYVQSTETEQKSYSIRRGDIFITRTSETSDELGMSCVALKDYPNATYNGFTKRMRPLTDRVLPEYIGYYLRTPIFRAKISAFSSIITRASLKNADLLRLTVELPNLQTQNKIASILSAYDNLIENNKKRIKLLEQMAQRLYQEWFVRFRFPGYEKAKFVDGIPQGWEYGRLSEVISLLDSKRIPLSSMERDRMERNYPYYGAAGQLGFVEDFIFDGTYLLLGEDGSVITEDGYPYLQYVWGKFWVNNHAHIIEQRGNYSVEFLYCMFKKMNVQSIVTGVAQPKISQGRLFMKKVLLPSDIVLKAFNEKIQPLFSQIKVLTEQNKKLTKQRDLLLPRLMSGKLAV